MNLRGGERQPGLTRHRDGEHGPVVYPASEEIAQSAASLFPPMRGSAAVAAGWSPPGSSGRERRGNPGCELPDTLRYDEIAPAGPAKWEGNDAVWKSTPTDSARRREEHCPQTRRRRPRGVEHRARSIAGC